METDRIYIIVNKSDLDFINFDEILQTSKETVRLSNDGTKALIKYTGNQPDSVLALTNKSQEYSETEIKQILNGSDWKSTDLDPTK